MIIDDYRKLMIALVSVTCLQYANAAPVDQGDVGNTESSSWVTTQNIAGIVGAGIVGAGSAALASRHGPVAPLAGLPSALTNVVGAGLGVLGYYLGMPYLDKPLARLGIKADRVSALSANEAGSTPVSLAGTPDPGDRATLSVPVGDGGNGGPPKPPEELALADTGCDSVEHQLFIQANQLRDNTQRLNMAGQHVEYINNRVDHLNNRVDILDNQVGQLRSDLQKLEKKAIRGIASTAALGAATTVPAIPGKIAVGVGAASYEGIQAVAFAVSYRPEKLNRMSFQAGIGAATGGKPVMRMGISYEF